MDNREYQSKCLNASRTEYERGITRQAAVMATGTGKTVVFSQIPEKYKDILPGQTMVLAHREELVDQAVDKMRKLNPTLKVDKEMATYRADETSADVIVASVPTIGRADSKRIERFNWDKIDKIITDEMHHSVAQTYKNIYERSGVLLDGSNKLLFGVTATDARGDGKALSEIYQKVVYRYPIRQAIEEGWLVDIIGLRVDTDTSLDGVRSVAGDFETGALAETINNPMRNALVVAAWINSGDSRQTVVFAADVQHAKDLAFAFNTVGIPTEAIWSGDPDRARKLKAHRNKDIVVLVNCAILTEGYDDWQIGCIVLARPTQSSVLFTQMIGRATRLEDGCGNLKEMLKSGPNPVIYEYEKTRTNFSKLSYDETAPITAITHPLKKDCIIIDVVDATKRHSLVTLPTLMGIHSDLDLKGWSVLEAAKFLEEEEEKNPTIDFSGLKDITQIKAYIESASMFEVRLPEGVKQNSEYTWQHDLGGGYRLSLPNNIGRIRIKQNILDKYELNGIIGGKKYRGIRDSIEEVFDIANTLVKEECTPLQRKFVTRDEPWRSQPPSTKQFTLLNKIFKGKALPNDLTKGQAADLITKFFEDHKLRFNAISFTPQY